MMVNFLIKAQRNELEQVLQKELQLSSIMQTPHITKVVLNSGLKDAVSNSKIMQEVVTEFALISGQKPIVTKAKHSIASFKVRAGFPIGVKVTLRNEKMYHFLYRLLHVALPRVRDFQGLNPQSFDQQANYSLGIKEHIIFPEIDYDKISKIRGFDVTIVTSTTDKKAALLILQKMGFPFRKQQPHRKK